MREFLDRLPALGEAKTGAVKKPGARQHEQQVERLIQATAEQRVCAMRYFSASSNATREYTIHPYRLVHAHGGVYVLAWVPKYAEIRTFAVERIQKLVPQDQRFEIQAELSTDAFAPSLGVNRGTPEKIAVIFAPQIRE
jgi:predicted DNA-binding transcriptional regulator YafY